MDEQVDQPTSQLDAATAAFRRMVEIDGNMQVHDSPREVRGKVFYEIPPDLAGRIRLAAGFDPEMSFCEALSAVVDMAERR